MVYGVIFTHLVALFPAEIIQLNRQYEGSIILDIQPKVSFFLCKITNLLIYSNNPISINAQSSKNRTGYGNNYFYNTLIYEGTKYGETSQFPIVGYKISKYGIFRVIPCITKHQMEPFMEDHSLADLSLS